METRIIDAAALQDVAGWERANGAKVLQAELLGDGRARAEVLPVATLAWYVNVWNCRADLVLVTGEGERCAEELFDLDAAALDALTDRVIYEDHCGAVNMSGWYHPLSGESLALFDRLMAMARPREVRP
jgi:hypothetical protein